MALFVFLNWLYFLSVCYFTSVVFIWLVFLFLFFLPRTQEELRVREEDQQTITVEVELKRHDSEPTISTPQSQAETRYTSNTVYVPQGSKTRKLTRNSGEHSI